MLIKFITLFIMILGLVGTLLPKVPGTLIMVTGIIFYGIMVQSIFTRSFWLIVIGLIIGAEIGARFLRYYLTQNARFSRRFTSEITGGSLAALLIGDVLFGAILGSLLWEVLIGQSVLPRFRIISRIVLQLAGVALLRFIIGIILLIITIISIM